MLARSAGWSTSELSARVDRVAAADSRVQGGSLSNLPYSLLGAAPGGALLQAFYEARYQVLAAL
jgi:hypothetical protein